MTWVYALIAIAIGFFMVLKTDAIMSFVGSVDWAESHLGTFGGTRMFIRMLGTAVIVIALLAATGILGGCARSVATPLISNPGGQ